MIFISFDSSWNCWKFLCSILKNWKIDVFFLKWEFYVSEIAKLVISLPIQVIIARLLALKFNFNFTNEDEKARMMIDFKQLQYRLNKENELYWCKKEMEHCENTKNKHLSNGL